MAKIELAEIEELLVNIITEKAASNVNMVALIIATKDSRVKVCLVPFVTASDSECFQILLGS